MEEKEILRRRAKNNRNKGNSMERDLAKIFRERFNYPFCKTSRQASRMLDACKVDLAFIPYNVQSKCVKASIKYQEVFEEMQSELDKNYPPTDPQRNYPKLIFHRRGPKKTQRYVVIQEDEFFELLDEIEKDSNKYGKGEISK